MAAKGAVVYPLAPHQALVKQGRASEGQAADTHTSWIQLHGTNVRPVLTALGGNLVCKSKDKKGKAALEQKQKRPTSRLLLARESTLEGIGERLSPIPLHCCTLVRSG